MNRGKTGEKHTPIDYEIRRSARKTLAIEITSQVQLLVRAPRWMSKAKIAQFVAQHEAWIEANLYRQRQIKENEPQGEQEAALRRLAQEVLPGRVAHYGAVMGLIPIGVKITGAKTRFGSCSAKNSLCFSWRLMQYPLEAVDYVVVHELAHIRHKNHGAAFYREIESILPDYKRRRAQLRRSTGGA